MLESTARLAVARDKMRTAEIPTIPPEIIGSVMKVRILAVLSRGGFHDPTQLFATRQDTWQHRSPMYALADRNVRMECRYGTSRPGQTSFPFACPLRRVVITRQAGIRRASNPGVVRSAARTRELVRR